MNKCTTMLFAQITESEPESPDSVFTLSPRRILWDIIIWPHLNLPNLEGPGFCGIIFFVSWNKDGNLKMYNFCGLARNSRYFYCYNFFMAKKDTFYLRNYSRSEAKISQNNQKNFFGMRFMILISNSLLFAPMYTIAVSRYAAIQMKPNLLIFRFV